MMRDSQFSFSLMNDTVEIPVVEHKQIILGLKQYYNNELV